VASGFSAQVSNTLLLATSYHTTTPQSRPHC